MSRLSLLALVAPIYLPLPAQNVGLTAEVANTLPVVVGQTCGGWRCFNGPFGSPPASFQLGGGVPVRMVVHGTIGQPFFLALSDGAGCQAVPGVRYPLTLAGTITTVGAGVIAGPAAPNVCGGVAGRAGTWLTAPASLPAGTRFVFQALTIETSALGSSPAFTNPIVAVIN